MGGVKEVLGAMTAELERKLVIAWRVWERAKESPAAVEEKERVLDAYCEGVSVATNVLHDAITYWRRAGKKIEEAVPNALDELGLYDYSH